MIVQYETEWGGEMSKWDALDSHMHAGLPVWQAEKKRIDTFAVLAGLESSGRLAKLADRMARPSCWHGRQFLVERL